MSEKAEQSIAIPITGTNSSSRRRFELTELFLELTVLDTGNAVGSCVGCTGG